MGYGCYKGYKIIPNSPCLLTKINYVISKYTAIHGYRYESEIFSIYLILLVTSFTLRVLDVSNNFYFSLKTNCVLLYYYLFHLKIYQCNTNTYHYMDKKAHFYARTETHKIYIFWNEFRTSGSGVRTSNIMESLVRRTSDFQNHCRTLPLALPWNRTRKVVWYYTLLQGCR